MLTIFSGTNRPKSLTQTYAQHCAELFDGKMGPVQVLYLTDLPDNMVQDQMYDPSKQNDNLVQLIQQYIGKADAFFFVIPEYNGSYPGVLKTLIDAASVHPTGVAFANKKAAILGVASGRAGNLRGIDHLTGVLHHMDCHVMPKAIPLGQANMALGDDGRITDQATLDTLEAYTDKFLAFCMEKSLAE